MIAAVPLLVLPVALYNLLLLLPVAAGGLSAPLFTVAMSSGGAWAVSAGDVLAAAALVILFVDLMKPSAGPRAAAANLAMSVLLLVACVAEFLAVKGCATSAFFLITLMVLLDALAGFAAALLGGRAP